MNKDLSTTARALFFYPFFSHALLRYRLNIKPLILVQELVIKTRTATTYMYIVTELCNVSSCSQAVAISSHDPQR